MDFQHWFEAVLSILGLIGGWFLRTLWFDMKELATKVQAIELLVTGQYVKREQFERLVEGLYSKLDKIEDKIDRKVDK